jgi:hypothetical protein
MTLSRNRVPRSHSLVPVLLPDTAAGDWRGPQRAAGRDARVRGNVRLTVSLICADLGPPGSGPPPDTDPVRGASVYERAWSASPLRQWRREDPLSCAPGSNAPACRAHTDAVSFAASATLPRCPSPLPGRASSGQWPTRTQPARAPRPRPPGPWVSPASATGDSADTVAAAPPRPAR